MIVEFSVHIWRTVNAEKLKSIVNIHHYSSLYYFYVDVSLAMESFQQTNQWIETDNGFVLFNDIFEKVVEYFQLFALAMHVSKCEMETHHTTIEGNQCCVRARAMARTVR